MPGSIPAARAWRQPFGVLAAAAAAALLVVACGGATDPGTPTTSSRAGTTFTTAGRAVPTSAGSTSTTAPPPPPPAPAVSVYDNTLASRACTLLDPDAIQAQFGGPVAPPRPIFPYCQWEVGADGFVALTIFPQRIGVYRSYPGLAVGSVDDLADGAFFASNKMLFFGVGDTTYALQFQRGAEWVDANRPRLLALAERVLDHLGYVPKPKPTTTIGGPDPDDPGAVESSTTSVAPSSTTTSRPRPAPILPPPPLVPPRGPIDLRRPLTAKAPLSIWVGGDSIAGGPAWAVGQEARRTGLATAATEFQVGTGLARPDFFDWYRHLAAVGDARDPDVMIVMFGGNDIQPMEVGGFSVGYGNPVWNDEYRRRVAAIMDVLAVRGRRLVWVGAPPMRDPDYNAAMAVLNEIYASEASVRGWVTYFPTWEMFGAPGQPGVFTDALVDASGVPQRVRFDDIHYNVPGSELLARALLDVVRSFTSLPPA